ncbi:MAG: hypothetical protein ACK5LL_00065 [Suipraeoptans sp.]
MRNYEYDILLPTTFDHLTEILSEYNGYFCNSKYFRACFTLTSEQLADLEKIRQSDKPEKEKVMEMNDFLIKEMIKDEFKI